MSTDQGTMPTPEAVRDSLLAIPRRQLREFANTLATDAYRDEGSKAVLTLMKELGYRDAEFVTGTGEEFLKELVVAPGFALAVCLGGIAFQSYLYHLVHCRFADHAQEQFEAFDWLGRYLFIEFGKAIEKAIGAPPNFDEAFIYTVNDTTVDHRHAAMKRIMSVPLNGEGTVA